MSKILGILLLLVACGSNESTSVLKSFDRQSIVLGDSNASIYTHEVPVQEGFDFLTYVSLHADEETAITAAKSVVDERGGRIVVLTNSLNRRLVKFTSNGRQYTFDPNRIYTDRGARLTLERFNRLPVPDRAVEELVDFGIEILTAVGFELTEFQTQTQTQEISSVIALHNNTNGRYSILSYLPGGSEEDAASDVFVNETDVGLTTDPDDFFYLTNQTHFSKLSENGLNCLLQNNDSVPDDGSLSVFSGRQGVDYINVEAEHGRLLVQTLMIKSLYSLF